MTLLRAMTSRPAEILGIDAGTLKIGAPADFILIDVDYPWQVKEADFHSRSRNTAFEGARLAGKVAATYVGGERVFAREGVAA
jgi:dihydroorotase